MNVYLLKSDNQCAGSVTRVTIIAPTVRAAEKLMREFNHCGSIRDPGGAPIQFNDPDDYDWIRVGTAFESDDEARIVDYYHHY